LLCGGRAEEFEISSTPADYCMFEISTTPADYCVLASHFETQIILFVISRALPKFQEWGGLGSMRTTAHPH